MQYLEKTLERSEITMKNVKQLNSQVKTLEQKQEAIEKDNQNFFAALQEIEQTLTESQENMDLQKAIIETLQTKVRENADLNQ